MPIEEYNVKQLEKELSEKEGRLIKVLSIRKTFIGKHVTICSLGGFKLEYYEQYEKKR